MSLRFTIKSGVTLLLFSILTAVQSKSQDIQVRYLRIENGLSNNAVNTVFQDHNGFMWFGTYDGLNRYDGYNFKIFRNIIGDSTSISANNINAIDEDALHRLWIGDQKEVNVYDPITSFFSKPLYTLYGGKTSRELKDNVLTVKVINGNKVLAGTQHNGLFYFDNTLNGIQVPLIVNEKRIFDYYVSGIEYDKSKKSAYIFVQDYGLFIYDELKHSLRFKSDYFKTANYIKLNSKGNLWLGNNYGLYLFDHTAGTFSESIIAHKVAIVNICEDKKGQLWIGTDGNGIWLLYPGKNEAEPFAPGNKNEKALINSNAVYAIYEDRDERKWIGTLRGGVNIVEPKADRFTKVVYKPSDNNSSIKNFILSFCEDTLNKIWIGTDGAGLRYWNRSNNSYEDYTHTPNNSRSISSNFITSVIKDAHNNVWLSTWFGGINRFDRTTQSFYQYTCYNTRTKGTNNNVWLLLQDSRQRIWASAVRNGGLYRFNPAADRFEDFDNTLSELQSITEDAEGNIWAGDYSSLVRIDTVNKKHRSYNIGFAVRCIHEDKRKNFWIGTQEGGLLLFNKTSGTFKRYTTSEGLPNNTILRMLEDKQGNLWLSTYNGLSHFDTDKKTFRNYSESDGLQSNQFSFNGALSLSNGEFLFGGIKGFNVFHPDSIPTKKRIPKIFLTDLKIFNTAVEKSPEYIRERSADQIKKIVVPYNKAMLSLDFLGLDYRNASEIRYAYYLKGWDKDWNFVNHTRTAIYSRLQEGNYTFQVMVSNTTGTWSEPQQLLQIIILPPWYRTWWAYCIYALLLLSAIYLYTLYKGRQAKLHYQIQLAHLETQKEKELNEKKIAFFTNVSHEFRTPLSLIINPIKSLLHANRAETPELKVVYRNAQRLLRLVDQLLLFKKADTETEKLNPVKINFYRLCSDVFACFTEQARSKKIRYELQSNIDKLIIEADREKLEIAIFNILSNAFKYTPEGGEITFKIEDKGTQVETSISDTGPGIPASEGKKLFERFYQAKNSGSKSGFGIGLYLVKNFIEAHHGTVAYTSEEGKGSTFIIILNKTAPVEYNKHDTEKRPAVYNDESSPDQPDNSTGELDLANPVEHEKESQVSAIINEMNEEVIDDEPVLEEPSIPNELTTDRQTLLIIDDDNETRHYLESIFSSQYKIYQSDNGKDGVALAHQQLPDLIISDIVMKGVNGLDLCRALKEDNTVSHIPIILLTGSSSDEMQLKGMHSGADDYIKKPFDKDILIARVSSILKRRNVLQNYFYNEITLGSDQFKVSVEYKDFLDRCMQIIETRINDDNFTIKVLAAEIGMSHSNLYKKIKAVSGQSVNSFIRFIRLRKAAEILINTEQNVNETANMVGFYNTKYFRSQFFKLFGINPSDYIKKFRKPFHNDQKLEDKVRR